MAPKMFSFGSDPFDPSHRFVTSWLFSPWILFALRASLVSRISLASAVGETPLSRSPPLTVLPAQSLYAFVTSFFHLGWLCQHGEFGGCEAASREFSYFTVLTFW